MILWYSWTSNEKWDVDIFFKCTLFPGLSPVLTNTIAIVGGEENVSVVQYFCSLKTFYQLVNHLVHSLKCSQSIAIPFVVVLQVGQILSRQGEKPGRATGLLWVEIRCSRHSYIVKEMFVPVRWLWHRLFCSVIHDVYVTMGSCRRNDKEKWPILFQCVIQEAKGFLGHNVC
jgi:hypothetical protein